MAHGERVNADDFNRIFREHYGRLYQLACQMNGEKEADDDAQEALLKLLEKPPEDLGNVGGWLSTVLRHVVIDRRRRKQNGQSSLTDEIAEGLEDKGDLAPDDAMRNELNELVRLAVQDLEGTRQYAVVLRELCGLSNNEAAKLLDVSTSAVSQAWSRGLLELRVLLGVLDDQ